MIKKSLDGKRFLWMGTTASIMEDGTMYHHIIALHLDEDSKSKADLSGNEGLSFLIYTPFRPSCQPLKFAYTNSQ